MHNRLLTFERFHQIKLKAQNIDNNSALESEPNSNNRIWALSQFQNHAKNQPQPNFNSKSCPNFSFKIWNLLHLQETVVESHDFCLLTL